MVFFFFSSSCRPVELYSNKTSLDNSMWKDTSQHSEAVSRRCSVRGVLRSSAKFTGKHLRHEACNSIKKEAPTQVFSCELCKIYKNFRFIKQVWWMLLNADQSYNLFSPMFTFILMLLRIPNSSLLDLFSKNLTW